MNLKVKQRAITNEFKKLQLWDKRCNKSISRISECIINQPGKSFSTACGSSLRQNGSRILSDNRVTGENLQEGHLQETLKRIKKSKVLLIAQDTTSVNYNGLQSSIGLGNNSTSAKALGLLVHSSYILNESGLPYGILTQKIWTRAKETRGKRHQRKELPIESKESMKWLEPIKKVEKIEALAKHELWFIGDRESDVYEYMTMKRQKNCHLLIRACQPRQLEKMQDGKHITLFNYVRSLPEEGIQRVEISRESRAEVRILSVSYDNVKILSPAKSKQERSSVSMGVVYAHEKDVPSSTIEWILLVDKDIANIEEAIKYLDYYTQRWKIERFHYILKQGLKIENLQFETAKALTNAIHLYSVVAWFTQWITYLGREKPETEAKETLDKTSLEVLEAYTKKKINNANQVLYALGKLGGFLGGSKRYPYPGLKSMWQGIQTLDAMKLGWLLAKSQFK